MAVYFAAVRDLLSLLSIPLILSACGEKRASITPERGPLVEAVYASGVVKAKGQYDASAVVSGVLANAYVVAGDRVAQGDPLFLIDDRSSKLGTRTAGSRYELARRNASKNSPILRERIAAVDLAKERMRNDSLLFVRQQALWDQQVGSRFDLEQRELAFTASRTAYENAKAALANTHAELENALEVARNNFETQQAVREDHLIRSLLDGIVYSVNVEQGELVVPQRTLAVLGSADAFELELQVDEKDIARIRPGQEVAVTLDSYPDQVFKAQISRIDPMMDQRSRSFDVHADLVQPTQRLYPNLTVEANIVIERKEDALTIPAAYLVEGDHVLNADEEPVPVKIGLRDLQRVEILSGISEDTKILRP